MKKIILSLLLINLILITSCDFIAPNGPLRNKMLDYYSVDENYIEVTGIIISIDADRNLLGIDILSEDASIWRREETGCVEFFLVDYSEQNYNLNINDKIIFTTSVMYFYNGHDLPIISLEKDGEVLLSFDEGKEMYLDYIKDRFG